MQGDAAARCSPAPGSTWPSRRARGRPISARWRSRRPSPPTSGTNETLTSRNVLAASPAAPRRDRDVRRPLGRLRPGAPDAEGARSATGPRRRARGRRPAGDGPRLQAGARPRPAAWCSRPGPPRSAACSARSITPSTRAIRSPRPSPTSRSTSCRPPGRRDVMLVGEGQNSLEHDLARAAAAQGRTVTPTPSPSAGCSTAPTTSARQARRADPADDGDRRRAGPVKAAARPATPGSTPIRPMLPPALRRWSADWDPAGAVQDVDLADHIGRDLANSDRWPEWSAQSEFRQLRLDSLGK